MGNGRPFLFGQGRRAAIVLFFFATACFFSTVDICSVSLCLLQHRLFDRAGSFVGVAGLVGDFVVQCVVGSVVRRVRVVPTSGTVIAPPPVGGASAGVAAAGPRAPLSLRLVFSRPSLVRLGMGMRLLLLSVTDVLRGGLHGRMGRVRRAAFLVFQMAAAVAFVGSIFPSSRVALPVGMVMVNGHFHAPFLPHRGRGGGRARGERRFRFFRPVCNPVAVVIGLVRMKGKVRLLGQVAVVMVEVSVALDRGVIGAAVAVVVRVWSAPYLALLGASRPLVLVDEAVRLVAPFGHPLLLLVGEYPSALVGEVAVVASSTHVVMRVVAASLGHNLCSDWRGSLIGCPCVGDWLLNRSYSSLSHVVWRSVTPKMNV